MRRALVWTSLLLACNAPVIERGVQEGELAVDLAGAVRGGTDWSLTQNLGKPTVVVFWASWCAPCMEEIPHLNALTQTYGDRIQLMGVNMGEAEPMVYMTQRQQGMEYESLLDSDGRLASAWRVRKLPLLLVIDAEGRIRFRGIATEQELKVLLDSLVQV